jgi:hypothetical protein
MSQSAPAVQADYRGLLRPEHPLVREIGIAGGSLAERVADVLSRIGERFTYRPLPGLRSLDELHDELRSCPAAPPEVGCFTLCLLASCLRAAGVPSSYLLVALGGSRDFPHFHAWVLLQRSGGGWWSIAPESLTLAGTTGGRLLERYRFHVLFNDQVLLLLEAEKREALLGGSARRPHLVLYGPARPELVEAIGDRHFRALVAELVGGGAVAPEVWSSEAFDRWVRCGLLRIAGGVCAPGERLLPVPADAVEDFRGLASPYLATYLQVLEDAVGELRRRLAETEAGRRHGWVELAHPLVAGLLMDLAVGRRLGERGDGLGHDGRSVVWAFEAAPSDNAFGVQWSVERATRTCFAQLWHARIPRQPPPLTPQTVAALGRAARPEGLPPGAAEGLYLRYLGLLRRREPGLEPTFPVLGSASFSALSGPLDAAAAALVDRAVAPALEAAASAPWWRDRLHDRGYRHALIRLFLELAADAAVARSVLPCFPASGTASPSWGRWLWWEPPGGPSFIPAPPPRDGAGGGASG